MATAPLLPMILAIPVGKLDTSTLDIRFSYFYLTRTIITIQNYKHQLLSTCLLNSPHSTLEYTSSQKSPTTNGSILAIRSPAYHNRYNWIENHLVYGTPPMQVYFLHNCKSSQTHSTVRTHSSLSYSTLPTKILTAQYLQFPKNIYKGTSVFSIDEFQLVTIHVPFYQCQFILSVVINIYILYFLYHMYLNNFVLSILYFQDLAL